MGISRHKVIIVGSGHAGAEAAWAAANLLGAQQFGPGAVALVTLDPAKTGVMSCNPAIGGLAKGQIVREIDAMGGLMGLAADATGIQFKVLNTSKGPAVRGPRAQCDKHAYAEAIQRLLHGRPEIQVYAGAVEELLVEDAPGGRVIRGVRVAPSARIAPPTSESRDAGGTFANPLILPSAAIDLCADAVVLTTGTFMRGLMHTGERKTEGGRAGEGAAGGISEALRELGFELGRLKTGTPPRLNRATIDWENLPAAWGDERPTPFSDLPVDRLFALASMGRSNHGSESRATFPVLPQVDCRVTHTCEAIHEHIRANIHRAPMFSGQIESVGPRYCPSVEDKVVRFAQRDSHHVFLEPESLRDDWIYCNGVSTSLPADVQDVMVRSMPGCEHAEILRYGYAVEYDMVRPHQIDAGGMTKLIGGLFLAGQINGTSGYEEAAGQGLVAGVNAARRALGDEPVTLGRDQAYIGVLMDDLVTKTPVEPYRMFTSRAEHRLHLRADNSADRLTSLAESWGLLDTALGRERTNLNARRRGQIDALTRLVHAARLDAKETGAGSVTLADACRRPQFGPDDLRAAIASAPDADRFDDAVVFTVHTNLRYEAYLARSRAEIRRHAEIEQKPIPAAVDYRLMTNLRAEAREALDRFRPATMGQASRLEGITPADLTLLSVLLKGYSGGRGG